MKIKDVVAQLNENEREMYFHLSASEYLNRIYYSKEFSPILKKLNTKEKLTMEEWDYLACRLFLVTFSAISEEDKITSKDKFMYTISKIGLKVCEKNKCLYNGCLKMVRYIESINQEIDINKDLLECLDRVVESKEDNDLKRLLQQHREAALFRNSKDLFVGVYKKSNNHNITEEEQEYMDAMINSYNGEKNLVKVQNK